MSVLANNFKTKFAGLLRGLLRKVDNGENSEPQTSRPVSGAAPLPTEAAPVEQTAAPPFQATAVQSPPAPARTPSLTELEMPLLPILEKLPADLRSKWMLGGMDLKQATISISVEKVLPQLALGTVKITFGEIRHAAPNLFRTGEEYDSLPIILPLNEVLSRLNPALITRQAQRTVSAPPDISGPFGTGGKDVSISQTLVNKPAGQATTHFLRKTPPPSDPIKMPVAPPLSFAQRATTPAPPSPMTPMTPRMNTPAPSNGGPSTVLNGPSSIANGPVKNGPTHTNGPVHTNGPTHTNGNGNGNGGNGAPSIPNGPSQMANIPSPFIRTPAPGQSHIPASKPIVPSIPVTPSIPSTSSIPNTPSIPFKPAVPVPATASASAPEAPSIPAPLAALSENWPERLRLEIAQLNLGGAMVALPIHMVEPALKRGRVVFTWHIVRSWIRPTPPGVSLNDAMEVELPLQVLAPLFIPRKKEIKPQVKAATPPSNVPNLFFGFPQPQPEELAAPVNAPEMPQPEPPVKPVDAKLSETNYYVWGDGGETPRVDETDYKRPAMPATDFTSRRCTPKEIIERAMQLPGILGAIVALPDGLKVAHQVPSDINPDTVAAFIPQLFSRVSQCSKELRMGELNNLNFTIGNTPWKIFRVNAVYFAAFGQSGQPLPTQQLAVLAGELDRKK